MKDDRERQQEIDDINNSAAGRETGRITRVHHDRDPKTLEQKRREKDNQTAYRDAVLAEINRINSQLETLYAQRDQIWEDLEDIKTEQGRLKAWRDDLEAGNAPELNEDGTLADERLEALIAAYERRAGHSIDRSDTAALLAIIMAEQAVQDTAYQDKLDELRRINEQIDPLERRLGHLQGDRDMDSADIYQNDQRRTNFISSDGVVADRDGAAPNSNFDDFTP